MSTAQADSSHEAPVVDVEREPPADTRGPTEHVVDEVCRRIAGGESIRSICDREGMPSRSTWVRWCTRYPWVDAANTRARAAQAHLYADEIVTLADESRDASSQHEVAAAKLRSEARRWVVARLLPRYAAKQEHSVSGQVEHLHRQEHQIDVSRLTEEEREQLDALLAKVQMPDGGAPALPGPGDAEGSEGGAE